MASSANTPAVRAKRMMRLAPSNGSGVFSYTAGNPLIKFSIPDTQALLVGDEIRLCGTFLMRRDGAAAPTPIQDCNMDRTAGVQSVIQAIHIGSRRYSSNVLESIQSYARLNTQVVGMTTSSKGQRTTTYNECGGVGRGATSALQRETLGTMGTQDPVYQAARKGLPTISQVDAQGNTVGFEFAMKLTSGLLSQMVDLSVLGGLEVQITLASNFAMSWGTGLTTGQDYQIRDPYLICPILYKSDAQVAADRAAGAQMISFMSYTDLYSVIDSTDQAVVHRMNANGLVSVLQNYVPTSFLNNQLHNSLAGYTGGAIQSIEYSKSGVRFPLEYSMSPQRTVNGVGASQGLSMYQDTALEPQILWNAISCVKPTKDSKRSQLTTETNRGMNKADGIFATGVSFDQLSNAGMAVNGTITTNIRSSLQNPLVTDAGGVNTLASTPYSQYSYYYGRTNALVTPGAGIQIMS